MKLFLFLVFMILSPLCANAEDWKTTDGKIYKDVKVVRHDDSSVTILYRDGGAKIDLSTLPPDIQTRFSSAPINVTSAPSPSVVAPPLPPSEQVIIPPNPEPITVDNVLNQQGYSRSRNISFARSPRFKILNPLSPSDLLFCDVRIRNPGKILTKPKTYSIYFFLIVTDPTLSTDTEIIFLADNTRIKRDDPQSIKFFPFTHFDGANDDSNEVIAVTFTSDQFKTLAFAQSLELRISGKEEKLPDTFQPYCRIFYEACQKLPEASPSVIK